MKTSIFTHLLKITLSISMLTMIMANTALAQDERNPLIVEADESLQWLRTEHKYIATGNASAEQGDLLMTANVITADYTPDQTTEGDHDPNTITFIRGDDNARFVRATLIATAGTITYDLVSEFVTLTGANPQVINGDDTLKARDTITYERATRNIIAIGQASIHLANGQSLFGDHIVVVLNTDESDIETVTATGKTKVFNPSVSGQQQAEADAMVYTNATGIAVLTGNVRVKDNNNIMTGNRAEIDTISGTSIMSADADGARVGGIFTPAQ